jgi:hypothetical protein
MSQKRQKKSADAPILQHTSCAGNCSPTKCWYDGNKQEGATFSVFDPVQGPVGDCYLIAALASMAWIKEGDLSRFGATGTYAFKSGNQSITKEVLYNSDNFPSGAQFGPKNYYWPLWYEKAYAKKNCASWIDPATGKATNCPNVCNLPGGAGMNALIDIAVNYNNNNKPGFTIKYQVPADIKTMKTALDAITTPGAKATKPAVAWTGTATAEIKADHTYSYLGYVDKNPDYYIVLRNPCTVVEPQPPNAKLLIAGKWPNTVTGPIDFSILNDGIFALKFQAITNGLTIGYVF